MKKHVLKTTTLLLLAMLWASPALLAQNEPFITKWNTENDASTIGSLTPSTNTQIYFSGTGTNYTIKWEKVGAPSVNGTKTVASSGTYFPVLIDFPSAGEYLIKVYPQGFKCIQFGNWNDAYGDREKLTEIQQWGDVQWTSMDCAFNGCKNMQLTATDNPDLSSVTDMGYMFVGCSAFNQPLNNWNVSSVTDMEAMFRECSAFNQALNNWDVSSVTNMNSMFSTCSAFNQPLNNWNVSSVTKMDYMFIGCDAFNQPLNNWDVSSVTNMNSMFSTCSAFNQPINNWDVSSVTNMTSMFRDCSAFNQDLSSWNLKSVVHDEGAYKYSLKYMFLNSGMDCTNYGNTLIGWANNTETPDNLVLGAYGINYSPAAQAAHTTLEGKGWTITDAGVDAACGGTVSVTGVSLDMATATITAGNTQQLTATVAPNNASNQNVTWSSSDNSIATVSATGLVTAVAAGNATITVTTVDGGFTDQCAVTVTAPANISLSPTGHDYGNVSVGASATQTFTLTNTGGTAAEFENLVISGTNASFFDYQNDYFLSTVDIPAGGSVTIDIEYTPTAAGSHTAVATFQTAAGNFTANLSGNTSVAVTGVSLDMNTATIARGNTQQLTATVAPTNAANQNVIWSSSDNSIATVSTTGLVTAIAAGNATITVTTVDGGFTDQCAVTVTAPVYAIDIDNHDFGVIDLAATASQDFTISNTGNANLLINSMAVNGTNAAEFTHNATTPLTITPGNSHTFTVTFDPAGLGWRNAHIDIATNAGNHTLTLKGAATSSVPTVPVSNWAIILGIAIIIGGSLLRFVIKN